MINRTQAPTIVDAVDFKLQLQPIQQYTLNNQLPVYAFDGGAEDVVMLEFVFYAGNSYEEKNIVAATTNFMLKNGTKQKNAFAINEHFDFYGAYLNRSCYNETATLTLHTLSKHLPHLLPVIAEILTECTFPEDELLIYQQNQKQKLEVNLKKCDFVANRFIDEYLFGIHHPYGKYTTIEDYDALNTQQLKNFYQQYYTNGKCLLFVAGKLPSDIQQQLNHNFGSLPFNTNALNQIQHTAIAATQKKQQIIIDPKGVQGAIRVARPFPNRHHPDYQKVAVLNTLFGGFFGSRLMSNIREDKGYTYGIHSYIPNYLQQSAWMIATEAGKDVCNATITEIYKEMELLKTTLVDTEELHLVKNYMMGSILGTLDGPFQIITRWKNYILNNFDEKYFYSGIEAIKSVSPQELQALAQKYLNPEEFYELVVF